MKKILKKIIALLLTQKIKYDTYKKINLIKRRLNVKRKDVKSSIRRDNLNLWRKIDKYHSTKWLEVYSKVNSIEDFRYISEQTYYDVVEPTLNNASFVLAYSDKNIYSKEFDSNILPKTLLRKINGIFCDEKYDTIENPEKYIISKLANHKTIVCKKSIDSGGGRGVIMYKLINDTWLDNKNNEFSLQKLDVLLGNSFIIQEYVKQHQFFNQFNPTSLNTIRFYTYRSVIDNEVKILHAIVRIGQPGSLIDNYSSNGIICGVNLNSGELDKFASNKYGEKFFSHNKISFENKIIPHFEEMKTIVKNNGYKFPYQRLLGHDMCLDHKGNVKMIEINNRHLGINFHQMTLSGSLFKDFTTEVINFCLENPKTIKIDYEI